MTPFGDPDTWNTSAPFFDLVRRVMNGIDVDPASNVAAQAVVQAAVCRSRKPNRVAQATRAWATIQRMSFARLTVVAALFLAACGSRTDLNELRVVDGPDAAHGGTGGAPEPLGSGGTPVLATGGAPLRPLGAGGAPRGAGGALVAGGRPGVGGAMVSAGGVPAGAGGHLPATGGAGAGGVSGAGGFDADAGRNYCDPAVQCAGRICRGMVGCGHAQAINCAEYVKCAPDEACIGVSYVGYCTACDADAGECDTGIDRK
jgi:hypothetical protein